MSTPMARSPSRRYDNRLIPSSPIHYILQRAAGLEALDLARDVFGYFVGIGVGGVVRGQYHLGVGPEPAVRRQRLGRINVERRAAERAVVEALQDICLVLQCPPSGLDSHPRAERGVAIQFREQFAIENVPRLRR